VNPLTKSYPELTPYQFASNRPIDEIDLDGLEYLDSKESFYDISLGQTWLKSERFFDVFGSVEGRRIAGTIRQDAYGFEYTLHQSEKNNGRVTRFLLSFVNVFLQPVPYF